jgi:hypothetical protein
LSLETGEVWIVIDNNRHGGTDAIPFSSQPAAVVHAYSLAPGDALPEPLNDDMMRDGWAFYLPYGTEGEDVHVLLRTVDHPRLR